jgi:putative DNA primase/helicase
MTIAEAMAAGGHYAKAGQEVRILDIPSIRQYGVWDELHGLAGGAALTDAIHTASLKYHGTAGPAFIERLAREKSDLRAELATVKTQFETKGGQEARAASHLAIVTLAGILGIEYGILRWPGDHPLKAAQEAFRLWKSYRGRGNSEQRKVCESILDFINAHGESRFSEVDKHSTMPVRERAGWWVASEPSVFGDNKPKRIYLFTSEGLQQALKNHSFDGALNTLVKVGALPPPDNQGKKSRSRHIEGLRRRVYEINPDKLTTDAGDE